MTRVVIPAPRRAKLSRKAILTPYQQRARSSAAMLREAHQRLPRRVITDCTPIPLPDASAFVAQHDHHGHEPPQRGIVALGLWEDEKLIGVGILGRAASNIMRGTNDVELIRLCILPEIKLTASGALYRVRSAAKSLGFDRVLTTGAMLTNPAQQTVSERTVSDNTARYLTAFSAALPGEDRAFGGNTFYIDLLPPSAHFHNLRTYLAALDWKALSRYVIQRAARQCEICGSQDRPEAHERWRFNVEGRKQDVARLMCVCKKCHLGIHYSLPGFFGIRQEIDAHITSLTGWDKAQLSAHIEERSEIHVQLSMHVYEVDLSLIERIGIIPLPFTERTKRITAAQANVGIFDSTDEGQIAMERYVEREDRKFNNKLLG